MWQEYVTCVCDMWHDSIYSPKSRMSCTWLKYMKKGVYVSRKPNLHSFDYIYPERPILPSLECHVHESCMTRLIHITPNESYVKCVCDMWHDSIYSPKSGMSCAWVMRDMNPSTLNRTSHPSNDMCAMTQYKSRKPSPAKSRKSHISAQMGFPPRLCI